MKQNNERASEPSSMVRWLIWKGVVFIVDGEGEQHVCLVDEVCDTFHRDGRLAGLGEAKV